MSTPEPNDDLSKALRAWKVEASVPASFQRDVWRRVSVRQEARQNSFWAKLAHALSALVSRPRYAFALIAVFFFTSISVAHVQARETNARHSKILAARYAASIDPLAMQH